MAWLAERSAGVDSASCMARIDIPTVSITKNFIRSTTSFGISSNERFAAKSASFFVSDILDLLGNHIILSAQSKLMQPRRQLRVLNRLVLDRKIKIRMKTISKGS